VAQRLRPNAATALHAAGQSLWLDSINRAMLRTGSLARYIEDLAVSGLTSNPTILGHAMSGGSDYDESIVRAMKESITDPQDLVYSVALEDLTRAAGLFRPVWELTEGVDGYVSLEVPPGLAYASEATLDFARRLHDQAGLENLLVKIPGTSQGLTAMEESVVAGVGINVTLLFSDSHYLQTADAYLRALEQRQADGLSLDVPSVASLFVSRWDKAADPLLPRELHGRLGVAVVEKVYASYRSLLTSERWKALAAKGARPQRVLWASTSTKDPAFPDTYYLGRLAAPGTINTMPEATLLAFADHGELGDMMESDYASAEGVIASIAGQGIDVDALSESLQRQGAKAFEADWAALLDSLATKATRLRGKAGR
jgi:transaldolase